jgi:hypothetical protein
MPHCVGRASATAANAAVTRSVCKPEKSDVHHVITFCVINSPYGCSEFRSSSSHRDRNNSKRKIKYLSKDGRLYTLCYSKYRNI